MKLNKSISLPHFSDRPKEIAIDTIIIHSCYAPNTLDPFSVQESCKLFNDHKVSPHYIIDRNGGIFELVAESAKAWHAGESKLPYSDDAREQVNDFSIGIEIIGDLESIYLDCQYGALVDLIADIKTRHPIEIIIGHDAIAPGRKFDPGRFFDWDKLKINLAKRNVLIRKIGV